MCPYIDSDCYCILKNDTCCPIDFENCQVKIEQDIQVSE